MNDWTKITKDNLFGYHPLPKQPLEKKFDLLFRITIEMSLNRLDYMRFRYNFLDLLAQFGGFMGIFRWIFTTFMAAWNTNALDNFMVSKLYKVRDRASDEEASTQESFSKLERSKWPHCGVYLLSWVPTPLLAKCCKKKDKAKALGMARAKLSKEMN